MYICIYIYMFRYVYICIYVCMYIYIYTHLWSFMWFYVHMHLVFTSMRIQHILTLSIHLIDVPFQERPHGMSHHDQLWGQSCHCYHPRSWVPRQGHPELRADDDLVIADDLEIVSKNWFRRENPNQTGGTPISGNHQMIYRFEMILDCNLLSKNAGCRAGSLWTVGGTQFASATFKSPIFSRENHDHPRGTYGAPYLNGGIPCAS